MAFGPSDGFEPEDFEGIAHPGAERDRAGGGGERAGGVVVRLAVVVFLN